MARAFLRVVVQGAILYGTYKAVLKVLDKTL